MGNITLITGGVRSGKSSFALEQVKSFSGKKFFLATAVPFDSEMQQRVVNHKAERGSDFTTIEEPCNIVKSLNELDDDTVVVIDCLTVWLGNLFYQNNNNLEIISEEIQLFCDYLSRCEQTIVMVTNEVGWGIVPDNALARDYRDLSGKMNQKVAAVSHTVYLCVSGLPLKIKGN
jgi:adenosylcobinamide kinase/adenosylcobinamide-phosphate guanylyltransferase